MTTWLMGTGLVQAPPQPRRQPPPVTTREGTARQRECASSSACERGGVFAGRVNEHDAMAETIEIVRQSLFARWPPAMRWARDDHDSAVREQLRHVGPAPTDARKDVNPRRCAVDQLPNLSRERLNGRRLLLERPLGWHRPCGNDVDARVDWLREGGRGGNRFARGSDGSGYDVNRRSPRSRIRSDVWRCSLNQAHGSYLDFRVERCA